MIRRSQFGRTGHASTRIIFGAYALSKATEAEADRILYMLLECGVNHIDTAPMYGNAEEASPRHPGGKTSMKKLAIDEWRRSQH